MTDADVLLIGVDGGATEVKAHAVACDDLHRPSSFELLGPSASRKYRPVPGFAPLPVADQIAQRDAGATRLTVQEQQQGALWVEAAEETIGEVARTCNARRVLVGMGMPGLKAGDGRGICVINNGPRIPDFLDRLEQALGEAGLNLVSPVATLGSDADYCGLGEEYAAEGLFRDVENAYYVGCGTGIADAMKLRGRLVPFDQAKSWIVKSWQMSSALGLTFEQLVSAKALNERYQELLAGAPRPGEEPLYPEVAATAGRSVAIGWMDTAALVLAELIFERIDTIKNGRRGVSHRGEAYLNLAESHEYRGARLDLVIVGQRIAQIYADPCFRSVFGNRLDTHLAGFISESGDTELAAWYLDSDRLKAGFVRPSKLRAAPALGAAVAAVHAFRNAGR